MIRILILQGDVLAVLRKLPDHSVQVIITSPPYLWLRNYGAKGQIGLEKTPQEYIRILVEVFREIRRVLRLDGTVWLNMGDNYAGSGKGPSESLNMLSPHAHEAALKMGDSAIVPKGWKAGDLMGMPWRLAFALQDDGWYLRTDVVWHKPNPMPESNKTRPTRSHEFIFLLSQSGKPLFWTHPERDGVRQKPKPDYYYHNRETLEDVIEPPEDWVTKKHFIDTDGKSKRIWIRRNKWIGWNYFYDAEAVKEPASESYKNDQRPLGVLRQRCNKKTKYPREGQFKPLSRAEERLHSGKTGHFHEREQKQDLMGNPTMVGFNRRWKERKGYDNKGLPNQIGLDGHSGNKDSNGKPLCDGITRNRRDVWKIATCQRKEAHFASFPDDIPDICIKASTSEYGCCPACGAPYMRVLRKIASTMNIRVRDNKKGIIDQKSGLGTQYEASEDEIEEYGEEEAGITETIGWRPTCSCNAGPPVPCVTLDPFCGRGTVALVSRELGRSSIGIDINPVYVEICRENLMGEKKSKKKPAQQKALDTGVVDYKFEVVP